MQIRDVDEGGGECEAAKVGRLKVIPILWLLYENKEIYLNE